MAEEHLSHIRQVFEKLQAAKLSMKLSKMIQRGSIFRTHFKHKRHPTITFEDTSHSENASTNYTQTGSYLPWTSRLLQKIYQKLTLLMHQQVKFNWTLAHHEAFLHLKASITQAPILH